MVPCVPLSGPHVLPSNGGLGARSQGGNVLGSWGWVAQHRGCPRAGTKKEADGKKFPCSGLTSVRGNVERSQVRSSAPSSRPSLSL